MHQLFKPHLKVEFLNMINRRAFLASTAVTVLSSSALAATAPKANITKPNSINLPTLRTGGVRMVPVVAGKYKVWTKKVGHGDIKVLLLHGGPGFTHEYLEAMESFLPQAGIEMYYYDQLGCGNSDQPDDASLWTLPRYVEEVEEVRKELGLDQFVLYGHSWGGLLGIEYALKYQQHLRGLVISNMTAGIESLLRHLDVIKNRLPPQTLATLKELEAKEDYDSPEYERIMMEELYPVMLCRLQPWPDAVGRAIRHANLKIYHQMQGKSEFLVTGNLKGWERWDQLKNIKVRTLTMGAKYDEMDPEDMQRMATMMPNARSVIFENGSHLAMWDAQAEYFSALIKFLRQR
jgi:proline iminopeptidase